MSDIPDEFCAFACPRCDAGDDDIATLGPSPEGNTVYKCRECGHVWSSEDRTTEMKEDPDAE